MLTYYSFPQFTHEREASPCDEGYVYIPIAFMVMLYLVYLVECWHCHTRVELQYKVNVREVYDFIQQMRDAVPLVWWKAVCFHYIRRARQVTRYRNGDAYSTTQVYYERVNSHTAGAMFVFSNCGVRDISRKLVGLEDFAATKIKFSKCFTFANIYCEHEYEEQRARFFSEYEGRDDYMETREGMDLMNVNFRDYMIAYSDNKHMPWYLSSVAFWVASLIVFSWPIRVLIEYKTAFLQYRISKMFGSNYLDYSRDLGLGLSMSRTLGSVDMEQYIRNNFTIVPSYSEAVLMNRDVDSNGNISTLSELCESRVRIMGSTPNVNIHSNVQHKNGSCVNVLRSSDRQNFLRRSRSRLSLLFRRSGSRGEIPRSHTVTLAITPEDNRYQALESTPGVAFYTSNSTNSLVANNCCGVPRPSMSFSPPPDYSHALQMSKPLSQMRRSRTERDMLNYHYRPPQSRSINEDQLALIRSQHAASIAAVGTDDVRVDSQEQRQETAFSAQSADMLRSGSPPNGNTLFRPDFNMRMRLTESPLWGPMNCQERFCPGPRHHLPPMLYNEEPFQFRHEDHRQRLSNDMPRDTRRMSDTVTVIEHRSMSEDQCQCRCFRHAIQDRIAQMEGQQASIAETQMFNHEFGESSPPDNGNESLASRGRHCHETSL